MEIWFINLRNSTTYQIIMKNLGFAKFNYIAYVIIVDIITKKLKVKYRLLIYFLNHNSHVKKRR